MPWRCTAVEKVVLQWALGPTELICAVSNGMMCVIANRRVTHRFLNEINESRNVFTALQGEQGQDAYG